MFSHEGGARSASQNRILAGYLASVAGFVNSCGFILVGTFTSHVTGNVGHLAHDAATGHVGAAISALAMMFAFFLGAFLVSVILESRLLGHISRAYASALAIVAVLLALFCFISELPDAPVHPRVDPQVAFLCMAMGMQNGLVTRISGAVVRTTHLTGVVTDLGIEAARWARYWRRSMAERTGVRMIMGPNLPERPAAKKTQLLATIVLGFLLGATFGALATIYLGRAALFFAVVAIAMCSMYALSSGRKHADDPTASRR
jgi:uncharacterized membrane protein YoaK (UPF0700 family)